MDAVFIEADIFRLIFAGRKKFIHRASRLIVRGITVPGTVRIQTGAIERFPASLVNPYAVYDPSIEIYTDSSFT